MKKIEAKIVADSISPQGHRITSYILTYPRFIHCFDEQTKILSQIGNEHPEFRSFQAIEALKCKVAQYENNIISFVYPDNFIKNTGLQSMISFNKKKFSMCVTNKHRVHTLKRTTNNLFKEDVIEAESLLGAYGTRRILQAGFMHQQQIHSVEELELIAWYVADGHNEGSTSNFHIRKERKKAAITFLLDKLGIKYTLHEYFNEFYGKEYVIRFNNPCWVDSCYEGSIKKLPDSACFMSNGAYNRFKTALLNSDGNVENNEYNTTSKILAYQIQVIALLHGDAMNIREYSGLYKQKFQDTNYISIRADKDVFNAELINTTTYCVTVPSSFVVVQRQGIAYISGNCELMTHRMFSRNSASSRAIPFEKMVKMVEEDPFVPIAWQKTHKGMQGNEYFTPTEMPNTMEENYFENRWLEHRDFAVENAKKLNSMGITKQLCNRLLEPFMWHTVLVTATEWENFFELRCPKYKLFGLGCGPQKSRKDWLRHMQFSSTLHPSQYPKTEEEWWSISESSAEIHIQALAEAMWDAINESTPKQLESGQWHIPFGSNIDLNKAFSAGRYIAEITSDFDWGQEQTIMNSVKIATARCARLSYMTFDGEIDYEKDIKLHNQLLESKHFSPFEHCARVMTDFEYNDAFDKQENGKLSLGWCNNFRGWIQYRYLIENT